MSSEIVTMLYDLPTWMIVLALLALALLANEIGFRFGARNQRNESDESRTVSNTLKGSVFALVALLLAFSYSATSNRYDMRQRVVLDQANAVGTFYLRAGLVDEPVRSEIRNTLRQYVDARLALYEAQRNSEGMVQLQAEINGLLGDVWRQVEVANRANPEAVRNSLLIPAANEVIDLSSTRAWANENHLPDPVLLLLLSSVIISSLLLGHSSGQANSRHIGLWISSNLVIALILYVVLDFDRPKRGLVLVSQAPLVELRATMN